MPKGFRVELEMGERHEYSAPPPPPPQQATVLVPRTHTQWTRRTVAAQAAAAQAPAAVKQQQTQVEQDERQLTQTQTQQWQYEQRQEQQGHRLQQRAATAAAAESKCARCSQPGAVTLTGNQYEALMRHCDLLADALRGFEQRFKKPVIVRYTMRRPVGGAVDTKAAVAAQSDDEPAANADATADDHKAAYEALGAVRPSARAIDKGAATATQTDEYYGTVELELLLRDAERMLAATAKDVEMAASLTGAREQTTLGSYDHELLRLKDQVRRIRRHLTGEQGEAPADDKEEKPCANLANDVRKLEEDAAKLRAYYQRQRDMV